MKRFQQVSLTAGLMLALNQPATPETASEVEPIKNSITIRLYDYAKIPNTTLVRATQRAGRILERAGIAIEWARCRTSMEDDQPGDPACSEPMTPSDIVLRILTAKMAAKMERRVECVGYSIHTKSGRGDKAGLFYHRIQELERQSNAPRAATLGIFMAHEIGHLLLPDGGHSRGGVMRAWWGPDTLFKAALSKVDFSPKQQEQMQRNARLRSERVLLAER